MSLEHSYKHSVMDTQQSLVNQYLELCDEIAALSTDFDRIRAHGFITAIAAAPWYTAGERILRQFGIAVGANDLPDFLDDTVSEFQVFMSEGLLMPYLGKPDNETAIKDWAAGFQQGVNLARDRWEIYRTHSRPVDETLRYLAHLAGETAATADLQPPDQGRSLAEVLRLLYLAADLADESIDDEQVDDLPPTAPPFYADDELAALSDDQLFELLLILEDRVPRNLFETAVSRGDAMLPLFHDLVADPEVWEGDDTRWWALHHAILVCGALPDRAAGEVLIQALLKANDHPDNALWDWFSPHWPALFANKGDDVVPLLQALVRNEHNDAFMRVSAIEALLSQLKRNAPEALETELDTIARIQAETAIGSPINELLGHILLDYPRERHRALLEETAKGYADALFRPFDLEDIQRSFEEAVEGKPSHPQDPWSFYDDAQIRSRQQRWRKEDERAAARAIQLESNPEPFEPLYPETYHRDTPKVGRNDPCPCGSGKKYKKCCLH